MADGARACAPLSGRPPPKQWDCQTRLQQREKGKNLKTTQHLKMTVSNNMGSGVKMQFNCGSRTWKPSKVLSIPSPSARSWSRSSVRCRYHCKLQRLVRRKNGREIAIRGSYATIFFLPPSPDREIWCKVHDTRIVRWAEWGGSQAQIFPWECLGLSAPNLMI